MYNFNNLNKTIQQAKAQGETMLALNSVSLQIYDGKPLQFNVTLKGHKFPTIKVEERTPGKFTVAVASEEGNSIDFTQAKVFTMDEPLEHLTVAFPNSEYIKQLQECLINSQAK